MKKYILHHLYVNQFLTYLIYLYIYKYILNNRKLECHQNLYGSISIFS